MIFLKLIWFYPISFAPQQIKTSFFLHSACRNLEFRSLIRTSELCSKVLSLGNSQINLEFRSLIRTFAADFLDIIYFRNISRTKTIDLWIKSVTLWVLASAIS